MPSKPPPTNPATSTKSRSKPAETIARLSKLITKIVDGRATGAKVANELRAIAKWLDGGQPKPKQEPVKAATQEEHEIFAHWRKSMGKPIARFTPERQSKIRARLKDGYSKDYLKRAISNVAQSSFHRGENERNQEYCDLTLICRNGAQLEKYHDMSGSVNVVRPALEGPASNEERLEQLRAEAAEQLKEGKTDAYNQTQAEIRRLRGDPAAGVNGQRRTATGQRS